MQNDNNCQMDNILLAKFEPSALPVSGQEPSAVQPTHESCDESEDDEWKYTKEGQGEKQLGLQGDTVVEEELPHELQEAGVTFSINERKASGNILQQQISINTSNLIESINDTFEGLTQNITELADQAAAAVTENKEEKLVEGIQNLNLSQSSTREKLDNIEDDEELSASEMNSRLNPEAKEFVPTFSPPGATENGFAGNTATAIPHHFKDELISQSPRKGRESNMEDIKIPAENEFEEEIAHKPHELTGDEAITEPTENGGGELFQEMNWKEAMHGSEKEEGPLVDSPVTEESLEVVDNQMQFGAPSTACELSAPVDLDNAGMKQSIYIENNTSNDDLNSVQVLPVDEIEIDQDSSEMANKEVNDVISKEEVQDILTLANDKKIETNIEEELEQKMENLLLSHDKEFTKDVQIEAEQVPINGVEMPPAEEPAAVQLEQLVPISEPIVEQPQEPSAPAAEESAASPVPVAEEAHEGLALGAAVAVVAAAAVATTAAATTKAAVKKVEDEKNQKNLKKTSSATKSKVPDTKKPAVGAAAKTSTVSSVSAAKRTLADKPKPTAAASSLAAKKTVSSTVSAAAPRPRAAPTAAGVKSTIEKKTTTSTTSTVKSRIDAKPPTTLATRKPLTSSATKTTTSKPSDETKSSSSTVKSSTIGKSSLGSKPLIGSTRTSATNSITKPRPATASSAATTNGTATKTATATKPTTLAPKSAGAAKPSTTSPRGTLTSTLRKTEAVKSPTKTTSSTITSRISTNGVTKSTATTRTTTTKTTTSSVPSTTRTTTSRLSVTGTTTGSSTTPTSKTNNLLAARKSTPLKKTTTNSSTTPTARKSIGSKLNSPANKPPTKDSSTPRPVTIPAQHQNSIMIAAAAAAAAATAAAEESKNALGSVILPSIEEPKLNGNASPDDVLLPSAEAAPVAAHPLIEMETV